MVKKCIILHKDGTIVENRQGKKIMSCKEAKQELLFGIGAIYKKNKYTIYQLKKLKW